MPRSYGPLRPAAATEASAQAKREGTSKASRVDPTTCNRNYTPDELEFMLAMDAYRREANRNFPTWSEALRVLKGLGYRKLPHESLAPLWTHADDPDRPD